MADTSIKIYKVNDLVIKIDRSKCLSCAACTAIALQTFELDDELICMVKENGPYDNEKTIKEAAAGCPNEAIIVAKKEAS